MIFFFHESNVFFYEKAKKRENSVLGANDNVANEK